MKLGWQLKEEVPLFIVVLVIVAALMYYTNPNYGMTLSFGTGFLIAAVITSLEVIFDAMKEKKKK